MTWISHLSRRLAIAGLLSLALEGTAQAQDRVADLPQPDAEPGQRWAIVIGISEYEDDRITPLEYAAEDAQAFTEFLRATYETFGVDDQHLLHLVDESATRFAIENALFSFLPDAREGDLVYLFFAGHGMPEPERQGGPQYLLPSDARVGQFGATAIEMRRIQDALAGTEADVIMFVDACHSGNVSAFNQEMIDEVARPRGASILVAADVGESAFESERFGGGHGAFTNALLEGLTGLADGSRDGLVSLGELSAYTGRRVSDETAGLQNPVANVASPEFRAGWPMSLAGAFSLLDREVDDREADIADFHMLYEDVAWLGPTELTTFVGIPDTIVLRLDEPGGGSGRIGARRLRYRSTDTLVARVDSRGIVLPLAPGAATIEASALRRRHETAVQVYEAPRTVSFQPSAASVSLTAGTEIRFSADVALETGDVVTALTPNFEPVESAVVEASGDGHFIARRPGSVTVVGSLAGVSRSWTINVSPPGLQIHWPEYGAVRLGDTLALTASLMDQSGNRIGAAQAIRWSIEDTTVLSQTTVGAIAAAVGRTRLRATAGEAVDSVALFVLGDLIISTDSPDAPRILTVSTITGEVVTLLEDAHGGYSPALSPDGRTIAFVSKRGHAHPRIYLMDADGANIRRLTPEQGGFLGLSPYQEHSPAWSYDGTRIYFVSSAPGNYEIFSIARDGSALARITNSGAIDREVSVAPDRPEIAFERVTKSTDSDVYVAIEDEIRNLTGGRFVPAGVGHFRESRPTLLGADMGALVIEGTSDYRGGDALVRFGPWSRGDLQRLAIIVPPRRDHEIIYAASPRGDIVAYHQAPRLGGGDAVITVTDLQGTLIRTIELPIDERLLDLAWGAVFVAPDLEQDDD